MNQFYSSLVVNSKKFAKVNQIFKPRYNREFFKRLTSNLELLESQIAKRCKDSKLHLQKQDLEKLKKESRLLLQLKDQFEKAEKSLDENDTKRWAIKEQLEEVEDRVLPIVVNIPNRSSKHVPENDLVLDEVESDFASKENLTKILSHTKLSYINNCYSKSVVGPNSHYYFGIGAKLQHGLADYFTAGLEGEKDFIPLSGMCLTKSAVIEAADANEYKTYTNDPGRVLSEKASSTLALHLVEASRESLLGFITTLGSRTSNTPLRLMTNGAGYRTGSHWFDSDEKRITQFETLHALVLNSSIESYSMKEYHELRDIIWNSYRKLELPVRLVHNSLDSMFCNEYDSHRIDVWLPSRQEWIQTARISHYLDYITVRTGMKRGHIVDSMVFDGQSLVAAIIENNQTSTGKFIIPSVIKKHMIHLTREEEKSYFRGHQKGDGETLCLSRSSVLQNFEQRRYLVKKNYAFGHSEKAAKHAGRAPKLAWAVVTTLIAFGMLVDWQETWYTVIPKPMKRFLYDKVFRVLRRPWWYLTYPEGTEKPEDLPFDQIDHSEFDRKMYERRQEVYFRMRPERGEKFREPKPVSK